MIEIGRDVWRSSSPANLLKQGHLEPVVQDCVQMASGYLNGWKPHNFPRQPVPMHSHRHRKEVFPDVQRERPVFQPVLIASCPVTGHQP